MVSIVTGGAASVGSVMTHNDSLEKRVVIADAFMGFHEGRHTLGEAEAKVRDAVLDEVEQQVMEIIVGHASASEGREVELMMNIIEDMRNA